MYDSVISIICILVYIFINILHFFQIFVIFIYKSKYKYYFKILYLQFSPF